MGNGNGSGDGFLRKMFIMHKMGYVGYFWAHMSKTTRFSQNVYVRLFQYFIQRSENELKLILLCFRKTFIMPKEPLFGHFLVQNWHNSALFIICSLDFSEVLLDVCHLRLIKVILQFTTQIGVFWPIRLQHFLSFKLTDWFDF